MIECFYFGMKYVRMFKQSKKKVFLRIFKLLRETERETAMHDCVLALLYVYYVANALY